MYADSGIPKLFHTAYALGACKPRLMVTLLGGAQVLQNEDTFNIGKRNHLAARKILWKASVMVHQEDVGGSLPRSVRVQVGSGRIIVFHGRDERELTPKGRERMALGHGV
jgi:chemotaxis protein CheD